MQIQSIMMVGRVDMYMAVILKFKALLLLLFLKTPITC